LKLRGRLIILLNGMEKTLTRMEVNLGLTIALLAEVGISVANLIRKATNIILKI
jgi:hypothetical protein